MRERKEKRLTRADTVCNSVDQNGPYYDTLRKKRKKP